MPLSFDPDVGVHTEILGVFFPGRCHLTRANWVVVTYAVDEGLFDSHDQPQLFVELVKPVFDTELDIGKARWTRGVRAGRSIAPVLEVRAQLIQQAGNRLDVAEHVPFIENEARVEGCSFDVGKSLLHIFGQQLELGGRNSFVEPSLMPSDGVECRQWSADCNYCCPEIRHGPGRLAIDRECSVRSVREQCYRHCRCGEDRTYPRCGRPHRADRPAPENGHNAQHDACSTCSDRQRPHMLRDDSEQALRDPPALQSDPSIGRHHRSIACIRCAVVVSQSASLLAVSVAQWS